MGLPLRMETARWQVAPLNTSVIKLPSDGKA